MAQCVSINIIGVSDEPVLDRISSKRHIEQPALAKPQLFDPKTLKCTPDGKTYCHYSKDRVVKFSLPCECGLYQENLRDPLDED